MTGRVDGLRGPRTGVADEAVAVGAGRRYNRGRSIPGLLAASWLWSAAGRRGRGVHGSGMLVAVFGDSHAHAEALDAVSAAAEGSGAQELRSLGDMIGGGPDPERVVAATRERCTVALVGNHDYGATGSVEPSRLGKPGSAGVRSIELARGRLSGSDVEWLRSRKPAARRDGVQCWHGSARNPVWEYVGSSNTGECLAVQPRRPWARRPHTRPGGVAANVSRRAPGRDLPRRRAGHRHGQVAVEPRRGRSPRAVAARLVGRPGRPGRRGRVLAADRPRGAHRDVAARIL
jgi:hypothetical protein